MDSSESYTYEPLPKGKYIRVLDLLPAEHLESPIQLELRAVLVQSPMASEDAYEALSYVWGTGGVGLVYCGGKGIGITANCLTALRYLRLQRKVRTLWVDAICINQGGPIEEKNHQVALMRDVYSGASKVLMWLGDKRGRGWLLFRLRERRSWWRGPLPRAFDRLSRARRRTTFNRLLVGVFSFCLEGPYFTRAWTLQEMVLATKAEFVYRHAVLPWHGDLGTYFLGAEGETTFQFYLGFLKLTGRTGGQSWEEIGRFYTNITQAMAERRCLRPHDKLFAMYGLLHAAVGYTPPPPDYDQDFLVAWEGFCRHLLVATRSLMYLVYPGFQIRLIFHPEVDEAVPAKAAQSPSWVRDFTAQRRDDNMVLSDEHNAWWQWDFGESPDPEPLFRECRLLPPTAITTAADIGRLWVAGKRLGQVSTIVSRPGAESDKERMLALSKAWTAVGSLEALATLLTRFTHAGDITRFISSGESGDAGEDEWICGKLRSWRNIILAGDFPALAPGNCQSGDVVVLLDGAPLEVILRPVGDEFRLIGRAVVASVTPDDWKCFETGSLEDFEQFCLV